MKGHHIWIMADSNFGVSFFVCLAMVIVHTIRTADGAPSPAHHSARSLALTELDHYPAWQNPCRGQYVATTPTATLVRADGTPRRKLGWRMDNFKTLVNSVNVTRTELKFSPLVGMIDTSDLAEWFRYNKTYNFLPKLHPNRSQAVMNILVRKWHKDLQVYVGGLEYLYSKQRLHENKLNENGNSKSEELLHMFRLARHLLCDIEIAINSTGATMPLVSTRAAMIDRLTYRNNNSDQIVEPVVDDVDSKFTKYYFCEFIERLSDILNVRMMRRQNAAATRRPNQLRNRKGQGVKRQRQRQRQQQQQQQHKQQQKLQRQATKEANTAKVANGLSPDRRTKSPNQNRRVQQRRRSQTAQRARTTELLSNSVGPN